MTFAIDRRSTHSTTVNAAPKRAVDPTKPINSQAFDFRAS
jgi:hypothetical protein